MFKFSISIFLCALFAGLLPSCSLRPRPQQGLILGEITQPIELVNLPPLVGPVTPIELNTLRTGPLKLGYGGPVELEEQEFMVNGNGKRINIISLEDFREASDNGYHASTTFEISMVGFFEEADAIEKFLRSCCITEMGNTLLFNPENILVSELFWMGGDQRLRIEKDASDQLTLGDYRRTGLISKPRQNENDELEQGMLFNWERINRYQWSFDHNDCHYRQDIIAKGDINCDGNMDMLLSQAVYPIEGTARYYNYYVILGNKPPPYRMIELGRILFK